VYQFPSNLESWDYPTPEQCWELLWLTSTLHPDLYERTNLEGDAQLFISSSIISMLQLKNLDYNEIVPGHRTSAGLLGILLPLAAIITGLLGVLGVNLSLLQISPRYLLAPASTIATEPAARVFWFVRAPRCFIVAMTGCLRCFWSGAAFSGVASGSPLVVALSILRCVIGGLLSVQE